MTIITKTLPINVYTKKEFVTTMHPPPPPYLDVASNE